MNALLITLVYLHAFQEYICKYANRVRRDWILPLVQTGGRNMFLLKSGAWIDVGPRIPTSHIRARYDCDKHAVISQVNPDNRMGRNSWLSVTAEGQDLSDFFSGLRVSEGLYITNEERLMLFASQKGWFPVEPLSVTMRDGSVESVCIFTETSKSMVNLRDINYIR